MTDIYYHFPAELDKYEYPRREMSGLVDAPVTAYAPDDKTCYCPECSEVIDVPFDDYEPYLDFTFWTVNGWCWDWPFIGRKTFRCPSCNEHLTIVRTEIDSNCPCCDTEIDLEVRLVLKCLPSGVARHYREIAGKDADEFINMRDENLRLAKLV